MCLNTNHDEVCVLSKEKRVGRLFTILEERGSEKGRRSLKFFSNNVIKSKDPCDT